ncbi:molecular chaperone GrpE [Kineococcus xinjiangensis]|uniref:Protein GrpE n=1 Tax=Kineococcus xinjiangensis TaxID=512762 RepID=A0A2S6IUR6_9ACTN|nr:nucleotide exchange factor GrpE [Kineococcus xinjiangensis]PPK98011.1 molecular chaperone GrpE [Kineococcus xinjiangensis]
MPEETGARDERDENGPVVRDRRRLDPQTGQLREEPAGAGEAAEEGLPSYPADVSAAGEAGSSELLAAQTLAAERLEDLQRLQAEYVNYRRRVDRDRDVAKDAAISGVAEALLPVLDDIHLARQHGDLSGPFAAIADKLEATLGRFGLVRYGENGEPFDPAVHEALMHAHSDEVEVATCTQVLQPGYRFGERVLRPARVAVADPQ